MLVRNTNMREIKRALSILNKKYKGNITLIEMKNANKKKTAFRFRLWCKDSHKPGARLSQSRSSLGNRKHFPAVCWHGHGDFWDILFALNPNAKVWAHKWITKDKGNWEDRNIGSMFDPLLYSEACECANREIVSNTRIIPQKDLTGECWLIQFQGLSACHNCEAVNTDECGGKKIRERLQNEKGISVPLGHNA